jgi:hypothetical protein
VADARLAGIKRKIPSKDADKDHAQSWKIKSADEN